MKAFPLALWHASIWQPLRASVGRTVLSMVAIALGVALGFAIYLMNRAATRELTQATRTLFGRADWIVQGPAQGFDENLYACIARVPGVTAVNPVVQVEARVVNRSETLTILGFDFLRAARMQPGLANVGDIHNRDRLASFDSDSLLLSLSAANALHVRVNDTLTLVVNTHPITFRVTGILPAAAYSREVGILDIAAAQWRLGELGKITRIELRLKKDTPSQQTLTEISRLLPPGVKITTPEDESRQGLQLSRAFTINLTALALVSLFTGAFLVYATQSLAVLRRRREFAVLHALGVTHSQQLFSVLCSGALLGIAGALLGVALGAALADVGLKLFLDNLNVGIAPRLQFPVLAALGFFLLGVLVSIAGSIAPALSATRIPTAQALKAGDIDIDINVDTGTSRRAYGSVLLWVFAALLLLMPPLFDLPLAGYAAIAFILFGAVLSIPSITRHVFMWLPRTRHVNIQTALAQLRGTTNTATASVATILVSVSLMAAMGIMVASLRGSFADTLNRSLPADAYVGNTSATSGEYLDASAVNTLKTMSGVERVAPTRVSQVLLDNDRTPVTLIARPIDEQSAGNTLLLQATATRPAAANTIPVWISVALADHYHLSAGSEIIFPLAGRIVPGSVRGVWRDNGRLNDAMTMDITAYGQLSGDTRVSSLALWLRSGVSQEEILQSIRQLFPGGEIELGIPSEIRATRLSGFDRVFAVTYLLEAVAVLIGLFGISVNASAQALARRAEFGVLRHLGFTRGQIAKLLAIEGGCLGILGVATGLLTGSVISLILIYVVGRQSFHWTMDLHAPIAALLSLAVFVPLAAAATAVYSGRQAMNVAAVRAVKEDW